MIFPVGSAVPLTKQDVFSVASLIGCSPQVLWSIVRVETSGFGFLPDRRPKMLFERHIFHDLTNGVIKNQPEISSSKRGGYGSPNYEYQRIEVAAAFDQARFFDEALKSASWGIGQIMGFNHVSCGYQDVQDFVSSMYHDEFFQLRAMGKFILKNARMTKAIRYRDWIGFAREYNGPEYKENNYDEKLRKAYDLPLPDFNVRALQVQCLYAGIDPGPIDGEMGPRTEVALEKLRALEISS